MKNNVFVCIAKIVFKLVDVQMLYMYLVDKLLWGTCGVGGVLGAQDNLIQVKDILYSSAYPGCRVPGPFPSPLPARMALCAIINSHKLVLLQDCCQRKVFCF